MPDRGPIDAVEPILYPRHRADEHEAKRQEQNGFGAEQLANVAPGRLAGGLRDAPESAISEHECNDRRRPDGAHARRAQAHVLVPIHLSVISGPRGAETVLLPRSDENRPVTSTRGEQSRVVRF